MWKVYYSVWKKDVLVVKNDVLSIYIVFKNDVLSVYIGFKNDVWSIYKKLCINLINCKC
jgi:hypothetical protein